MFRCGAAELVLCTDEKRVNHGKPNVGNDLPQAWREPKAQLLAVRLIEELGLFLFVT